MNRAGISEPNNKNAFHTFQFEFFLKGSTKMPMNRITIDFSSKFSVHFNLNFQYYSHSRNNSNGNGNIESVYSHCIYRVVLQYKRNMSNDLTSNGIFIFKCVYSLSHILTASIIRIVQQFLLKIHLMVFFGGGEIHFL